MTRWTSFLPIAVSLFVAPALAQDAPAALTKAVRQHFVRDVEAGRNVSFRHSLVDLDGDGIADAIALITSPSMCGSGGCNMVVLRGTKTGFSFVSGSTITNAPIRVADEKSHGWKTLIVHVRGGGLQPHEVLLRFDGSRYPLNPSLQPSATPVQLETAHVVLDRP